MSKNLCRVCLSSKIEVIRIENTLYQVIFEKLANNTLITEDGRPTTICHTCLSHLRHCRKLMDMSCKTEEVLTQFLNSGIELNEETVNILNDKHGHKLAWTPIQVMSYKREDENPTLNVEIKIEPLEYNAAPIGVDENSEQVTGNEKRAHIEIQLPENEVDQNEIQLTDEKPQIELSIAKEKLAEIELSIAKQKLTTKETKLAENEKLARYEIQVAKHTIHEANMALENAKLAAAEMKIAENNLTKYEMVIENGRLATKEIEIEKAKLAKIEMAIENSKLARRERIKLVENQRLEQQVIESEKEEEAVKLETSESKENEETELVEIKDMPSKLKKEKMKRKPYKKKIKLIIVDGKHACPFCGKKYKHRRLLLKHARSHTDKFKDSSIITCYFCKKTFTTKSAMTILQRHIQQVHNGDKPYNCDLCDVKCTQKNDLIRHMRVHTGEKPYTCDMCNTTFSRKSNLSLHIQTHMESKPFVCSKCSNRFSRKYDLKRHVKRKHTDEKPYACGLCDFRSVNACYIKQHVQNIHRFKQT